jgi:hypothetical protein
MEIFYHSLSLILAQTDYYVKKIILAKVEIFKKIPEQW